ncbi:M24 family metallopeptidase [Rhodobacteraceae bacterium NNCM2]|nr:M24 family metallopeptidase [Coraliihabitans acroporae]
MPAGIETPFTRAEYADRIARVRRAMDAAGVAVMFTCDPSNMAWLTGYDGWSFYVHQGVIIGPTGDPVFWGRKMDAMGALRTCFMEEADITGYPDNYVMSTERHPMDHLALLLRERGWASLPLGVEMENYYYSAKAHAVLTAALPGTSITDRTALINWQRAVKSPAELGFMRRAARIVERMHETIREVVTPGKRKNEVAAEIFHTALTGAEDQGVSYGGDYPAITPLMPTGKDATAAHLTWDDKPFESGAGTFFEIAGVYRRYHTPLCRTVYLGTPPADMLRADEAAQEGLAACIDTARAGNTTGDVARAFYTVLARHGIEREGRLGYPIGLSYPPDWGERTFSIRPEDKTVLRPDMTIHLMPALWMTDWGLETTETVRIAETGPAECFADVSRALFVKP